MVPDLRTLFVGAASSSTHDVWSSLGLLLDVSRGRELRLIPRFRFLVTDAPSALVCISTSGDDPRPETKPETELTLLLLFLLLAESED